MRHVTKTWTLALIVVVLAPAASALAETAGEGAPAAEARASVVAGDEQGAVPRQGVAPPAAAAISEPIAATPIAQPVDLGWPLFAFDAAVEIGGPCFPPSIPPPSCQCSSCCECNKCWQGSKLVKIPCDS